MLKQPTFYLGCALLGVAGCLLKKGNGGSKDKALHRFAQDDLKAIAARLKAKEHDDVELVIA